MSGSIPPAPTDPQVEPPAFPSGQEPKVDSTPEALRHIRPRTDERTRFALLVAAALVASLIAGAFLFHIIGYRSGYGAGFASVGYFEETAIADSMKADVNNTFLAIAGLVPEPGQHGLWHVARFRMIPAESLCKYGNSGVPDTMRIPLFSEHTRAAVGRSYRSGSDGRIHYVDR